MVVEEFVQFLPRPRENLRKVNYGKRWQKEEEEKKQKARKCYYRKKGKPPQGGSSPPWSLQCPTCPMVWFREPDNKCANLMMNRKSCNSFYLILLLKFWQAMVSASGPPVSQLLRCQDWASWRWCCPPRGGCWLAGSTGTWWWWWWWW